MLECRSNFAWWMENEDQRFENLIYPYPEISFSNFSQRIKDTRKRFRDSGESEVLWTPEEWGSKKPTKMENQENLDNWPCSGLSVESEDNWKVGTKRLPSWGLEEPEIVKKPNSNENGFEVMVPEYWDRKRVLDEDSIPWIEELSSKRPRENPQEGMITLYNGGFQSDEIAVGEHIRGMNFSQVPKSVFKVSSPEQRIVVWRDPKKVVMEGMRRRVDFHPPMSMLYDQPRIEVLDSDDEDELGVDEEDDDLGVKAMDLSD